jgi:hypothetical protein
MTKSAVAKVRDPVEDRHHERDGTHHDRHLTDHSAQLVGGISHGASRPRRPAARAAHCPMACSKL